MGCYAIEVDTHTHSVLSGHAWSTVRENLTRARAIGLKGICITEHSSAVPGAAPEFLPFSLAMLPKEENGVRVYAGLEADIVSEEGKLCPSDQYLQMLEFCIASMHLVSGTLQRAGADYTETYFAVLENRYVSAIGHADRTAFPCNLEAVVRRAGVCGKLMEINNASLIPARIAGRDNVAQIARCCMQYDVPVCVSSDAHMDTMIGDVRLVQEMLRELKFPEELIINRKRERFDRFLEARRKEIENCYWSEEYAKNHTERLHRNQDSGL